MAKHRCYHKQWSQFVTHKYASNEDDLICFFKSSSFYTYQAPVPNTLKIMTFLLIPTYTLSDNH